MITLHNDVVFVQLLSHVQLSETPWTAACQTPLSFTISQSLFKLMFIELVMPSNHLILCCPLLLLPSIFPSIRVFSKELALHIRWPKYRRFTFSISTSNEYSELISFGIDQFDLLAVHRTFKSLLQHHSSKASILGHSAFFMVQLSHPYIVKVKSLSHVQLFATPWTIAYQAPPSMGFSRKDYWSGLLFPSPGDLPNPGNEPGSPTLSHQRSPYMATGKKHSFDYMDLCWQSNISAF